MHTGKRNRETEREKREIYLGEKSCTHQTLPSIPPPSDEPHDRFRQRVSLGCTLRTPLYMFLKNKKGPGALTHTHTKTTHESVCSYCPNFQLVLKVLSLYVYVYIRCHDFDFLSSSTAS